MSRTPAWFLNRKFFPYHQEVWGQSAYEKVSFLSHHENSCYGRVFPLSPSNNISFQWILKSWNNQNFLVNELLPLSMMFSVLMLNLFLVELCCLPRYKRYLISPFRVLSRRLIALRMWVYWIPPKSACLLESFFRINYLYRGGHEVT